MGFHRLFFALVFVVSIGQINVAQAFHQEEPAKQDINIIDAQLAKQPTLSMPNRLEKISGFFLGKPYLLGALGEGVSGEYDQFPLYRTDAFDCLTFVETVLAIALSNDFNSFKLNMNNIRYQDGKVSFIARNHFTDLDWNPNSQRLGILKDITPLIKDRNGKPVFETASAVINKPSWYQHFTKEKIRLLKARPAMRLERLRALKELGQKLSSQTAIIPYIPLRVLFDENGTSKAEVFKQIPDGSVIEIIRPNWDLTKIIGTHLNVSHLGFAFWRDGVLMFRNASTIQNHVVDQPLVDYLSDALQSPTIKGINIQVVRAK